jgi:hypothetical protein
VDKYEAARLLSVAESEIVEVRQDADGWYALHHDMASHTQVWRHIPAWQVPAAAAAEEGDEPEQDGGDSSDTVEEEEAAEPVGDLDGDGVPDGTAAEVLEWVADDPQRAGAALVAETARERPRSTLVAHLEKLTG